MERPTCIKDSAATRMSSSIKPFKISVPDSQLSALQAKLDSATFPNEIVDAGWSMGSPLADIKRLTTYWRDQYSWRKAEAYLNTFPQFTVPITTPGFDTLEIHFIHQRSKRENAIPLLFIHGWPGSYIEVLKILPLLTDSSDPNIPSFHVVAPSLPNCRFLLCQIPYQTKLTSQTNSRMVLRPP